MMTNGPLSQQMDNLKAKLFEKLEQSLEGLQLKHEDIANVLVESNNPSEQENNTESVPGSAHDVSATRTSFISVGNQFSY